MEDNKDSRRDEVFSKRVKAGKRTYFFDVKATRGNDYYITITESKRRQDGMGYAKHKIFLYKEDFNKFMDGLNEAVEHVKTELMPDYDFEEFDSGRQEDSSGFSDLGADDFDEDLEEFEQTGQKSTDPVLDY
jgi:hypothetical protein